MHCACAHVHCTRRRVLTPPFIRFACRVHVKVEHGEKEEATSYFRANGVMDKVRHQPIAVYRGVERRRGREVERGSEYEGFGWLVGRLVGRLVGTMEVELEKQNPETAYAPTPLLSHALSFCLAVCM